MHEYPEGTIVGLLSDSHGKAPITRRAVELLTDQCRADVLIHLGDVCDDRVIDALAGHRVHLVFGNCDWDWRAMSAYAESLGILVEHPAGSVRVGSNAINFSHGHEEKYLREAVNEHVSYYCQGHTHVAADERRGSTRLLNPGALFRASRYTVAWLDPTADRFEVVEVESGGE